MMIEAGMNPFLKRSQMVPLIIIVALLVALYFRVFEGLIYDWSNNPDYSHGFLIPAIALYLVWLQRDKLPQADSSPSYWGILIFILGIGQYALGTISAEHFLQSTSMIVVILGIVLFLWGWGILRIVLIPSLYLIFMIPLPAIIWNKFAFSLKLFATEIAVVFIQALGIIVLREGNVLTLPTMTLEVVDACSGLRSLISMLALSALISLVCTLPIWKKWILFLSAIPIAITSNVIRLVIIAVFAQRFGIDITRGMSHTLSGLFVFGIGIMLFYIMYEILSILPKHHTRSPV
jgi:exosortase